MVEGLDRNRRYRSVHKEHQARILRKYVEMVGTINPENQASVRPITTRPGEKEGVKTQRMLLDKIT